ncbi:MAG: hypothetical protein Kilf2KO_19400 [Rhodospirillales bacterium]
MTGCPAGRIRPCVAGVAGVEAVAACAVELVVLDFCGAQAASATADRVNRARPSEALVKVRILERSLPDQGK